ncbi:MAG: rod shape-determining protein [Oscillospiraceae bacterium]|nr:rod shape-determining protein [Oscillospiraceae bacterium]MBQ5339508.1 rod shape-determining protein [Oscillospiraceae bacterium]MBQ9907435.1 rod shape-determining protein [Oscillospiraceae bacterium]MBR5363831.1 rod shape-determining protein [Oscillospiraceae bacterium]
MDIGIDLGTANIIITKRRKGVVLNEPSVIAFNKRTERVVAVGEEAYKMEGRSPSYIAVVHPLQDGVISDDILTQALIRELIDVVAGARIIKPRIVICVPSLITDVEKRAILDAAMSTGSRKVHLIQEPLAALLGAGISINRPVGHMVVDIGGGTTDIAVVSMNGIVTARSMKIAGNKFDQSIIRYVQNKYQILLGAKSAEQVKKTLCNLYNPAEDVIAQVKGRNISRGLPDQCDLSEAELSEALEDDINEIGEMIRRVLEETPPELVGDICANGILLTGGGALLGGLEAYLTRMLGVPCRTAKDPLTCVARGTEKAFTRRDILLDGFERIDAYTQS